MVTLTHLINVYCYVVKMSCCLNTKIVMIKFEKCCTENNYINYLYVKQNVKIMNANVDFLNYHKPEILLF